MREKILFDDSWYFHRGDVDTSLPNSKKLAYKSAKTQRFHVGPAFPNYNVSGGSFMGPAQQEEKQEKWQLIDLPHDYMAGDEPDPANNEALGFVKRENAWYIKRFNIPAEDEGKRITLLFDGVATHATVYLNGSLMKHSFCGYTPFEVDITDMLRYGEEKNSLAVYVNTDENEGWWYEGAGIYRHVWLIKTDAVAVDLWGVWARPEKGEDGKWSVATEATVRNDSMKKKSVRVLGEIIDADGSVVATSSASGLIEWRDKRTFKYSFELEKARLWSPETPYQYTMRTHVYCGTRETDVSEVKFGCRTIRVDADEGLFINDKKYLIKGVCVHENCGLTGKFVPDNIHRHKVELLKQMGANGYRTAHYPHSEAMMDALDENGFMVLNETRWFESTDEGRDQLTTLIKRDRNRPSVIFWSIGNEEPHFTTPQGVRICRSLYALAKKLDPTRPVLAAITHEKVICGDEVDVVGMNYLWKHMDNIREKYKHKPFVSSECGATGTTRGWYYGDEPSLAMMHGYDHDINTAFISRENTWKRIMSYPWMMGGYQWTGFEYRGEATWPRLCSQSGAIDLYMQKKDAFYQNLSHWGEAPMVHLLPHWNFEGREGESIKVFAYTNQPYAELFINDRSCGRLEIEPYGHGEWYVPYEAGKLEVKVYGADGTVTATDMKETSGAAYALKLDLDTPVLRVGDYALITCSVTDKDGKEVPDACPEITFTASGAGKVYSTGSAVTDHKTIYSNIRKMWMGKATVCVKLAKESGKCTLHAFADGLRTAGITFDVNE